MGLQQYTRHPRDLALESAILALEATAWPPEGDEVFPAAPQTYVCSFLLLGAGRILSHVAVRRCPLYRDCSRFAAYGLSEVVTHPDFRGRGLATTLIRRAAAFIQAEGADLSLFTCAPERVSFYTLSGWMPLPGACLVGGSPQVPFRSDSLGLITMGRFFSPKAQAFQAALSQGDIFLDLGEGELW